MTLNKARSERMNEDITLITVYDNYQHDSRLKTGFGFACLIKIKDFKAMGVENAAPCHCSGDVAIGQFKEKYRENFIANGVGKVIKI